MNRLQLFGLPFQLVKIMPKQWRTGSKEAPQRAQRALNSRVATADQALAVAADAGNKHALADAAGAGRRSRKRKVPKVAGQSTHQKNQAPKAKGALAAAAGAKSNRRRVTMKKKSKKQTQKNIKKMPLARQILWKGRRGKRGLLM